MTNNTYEISFPKTEAAFAELYANSKFSSGEHIDSHLTSGDVSIELGSELFDPSYHDVEDIDFSLEDCLVSGDLYVPTGLATRPMVVGIIQDAMTRSEDPRINRLKTGLSNQVRASIIGAVPQTDPINGSVVSDVQVDTYDFIDVAKVTNRQEGIRKIEGLALPGMVIVISDFHNMDFAPKSLEGAVAVKVNHLVERQVPSGMGKIAFGGFDLNTNKPKELRSYNDELDIEHIRTLDRLHQAGAQIVSLISNPRIKPNGFDAIDADVQLAHALSLLQQ